MSDKPECKGGGDGDGCLTVLFLIILLVTACPLGDKLNDIEKKIDKIQQQIEAKP